VPSPCTLIPIEQGGGAGTAGGHWDEPINGSSLDSRSVVRNSVGFNFRNELMTGWLNTPVWMGTFTCMALEDAGFDCVACVDSTDCASGYICSQPTNWLPGMCVLPPPTQSPTRSPTARTNGRTHCRSNTGQHRHVHRHSGQRSVERVLQQHQHHIVCCSIRRAWRLANGENVHFCGERP
jgi:hypothetical protein